VNHLTTINRSEAKPRRTFQGRFRTGDLVSRFCSQKDNVMRCRQLLLVIAVIVFCRSLSAEDFKPLLLAEGSGADAPKQPQAFVSEDGNIDVVYAAGDRIIISSSTDGGASFGQASGQIECRNLAAGMRRGPRIVRSGKHLVVTAIGGQQGKGRDGDLSAWYSADNGATWSEPIMVNDAADSAREGLHAMTAAPDGTIYCVWLDLRNKQTEIYLSKSTDSGSTWSENIAVYRSPDGSVCECCHPSVVATNDTVAVMFRNSLDGNRDMYATASMDHGTSFEPAKKLGTGTWALDACPMDGGMLAIDRRGSFVTAWRRDREIFSVGNTAKGETLIGRGEQPWVTATSGGSVVVWTTGREGDLMMQATSARKPVRLAAGARSPVICSAAGDEGKKIVCWETSRDGHSSVNALMVE